MTIHVLTNAGIWLQEFSFAGFANAVAFDDGVELQEVTVFGDTSKRRVPGLYDAQLSVEGYFDADLDKGLYDNLVLNNALVTVAPSIIQTARAYILQLQLAQYTKNKVVGEPYSFSVAGSASAGRRVVAGAIAHASTFGDITVDGQSLGVQTIAVPTGSKLYAAVHVPKFVNASPTTIYLESDDNAGFTTPTIRHTFTAFTAVGSQLAVLDGPYTDTYWRVRWDLPAAGGPIITVTAVIGIGS
jgi:hypothetical protein